MKNIKLNLWSISKDGKNFIDDYTNKKEAVEAVKKSWGKGYIGKCVEVEFTEDDISCDYIYDNLEIELECNIGDVAKSWEISLEHQIELSNIIEKIVIDYINKNGLQPTGYYNITDVERVI